MCCSWSVAVLVCNELFLSILELAGTSWNQHVVPFPQRLPLQPLAPQALTVTPNTEYLVMFKYRAVSSLHFFPPVRVKSGFECWITNWWTVLHYIVETKQVIKHVGWSRLLTSQKTCVFISLCGNICFQKLPVQFFINCLNKNEQPWHIIIYILSEQRAC